MVEEASLPVAATAVCQTRQRIAQLCANRPPAVRISLSRRIEETLAPFWSDSQMSRTQIHHARPWPRFPNVSSESRKSSLLLRC